MKKIRTGDLVMYMEHAVEDETGSFYKEDVDNFEIGDIVEVDEGESYIGGLYVKKGNIQLFLYEEQVIKVIFSCKLNKALYPEYEEVLGNDGNMYLLVPTIDW